MYLDVFSDNSFETNCWLLGADGTDEVVVVDPGFSPERVRAMLDAEDRRPVAALATHGHFDHIGSAAVFCGDDLPFYIHEADVAEHHLAIESSNMSRVAERVGLERTHLYRKLKQLGIRVSKRHEETN